MSSELFNIGQIYYIEGKPFEYRGKANDRLHHVFMCVDNPEDTRYVSVFLGDYLQTIYKGTA